MVLVFKTTVHTRTDVQQMDHRLNQYLGPKKWNFDLDDCDKILRIELNPPELPTLRPKILELLQDHGFGCEELSS